MSGIVRRLDWDRQPPLAAAQPVDDRGTASTPENRFSVVGTPSASVVSRSAGRFGPVKAWATDGAATYFELSQSAGNFGTGPFSVTLVLRSNSTVASSSGLIGNNQNGTAGGWLLYAASTTTLRINTDAGFSTTLDCGVNVFDGVWHVVTLTRNSAGTYQFIVDGIADASATVAVFDVDQARTVIAGAQKDLSNVSRFSPFDFALIDLRKRAFSVPEAVQIHQNPWQLFEPENDPVFYSLGGGAALIDVPAGAVTLTGYAPTVTAGGTASTSVPAGAATLTAYAPTVTAGGTASTSVPLGTVTLTGYAPTVTVGGAASIDVPLGTVALTGYAPTVTTGGQAQIDVPLGTVTLTGYVPTVTTTEHVYIAVPTAAMTLAAYVPTVTTSGTPDTWTPVSASAGTWTPQ